jgi:hypothetical protein
VVRLSTSTYLYISQRKDERVLKSRIGVSSPADTANGGYPVLRKCLANPGGQRSPAWVAQCPHRCSNAPIMRKVVRDSGLLLF